MIYKVPATYMRGGTSKGVFILESALPAALQSDPKALDQFLLRLVGSPDPYGKQMDGMGGGSSSTSKVVLISPGDQKNHDINYRFAQVAIEEAFVDWSGNCGNLSAAVGGFAINKGLLSNRSLPENGTVSVRVWQCNIQKTIVAHVPVQDGQVQESGDFVLDGVTFPAAEVQLDFLDPASADESASAAQGVFPTGNPVDTLSLPGGNAIPATFINAGIPTAFVNAGDIGLTGTENQNDINQDQQMLSFLEKLRAQAAVKMGLISAESEARQRQHTPKIAFVSPATDYVTSSGRGIIADQIDLQVRAMSMGKLHHAMMGTAAVAIACAAAIPGTLVSQAAGGASSEVCFGHPSGTLTVGADVDEQDGQWQANSVSMSRSARTLMEGWVYVPE